MSQLFIQNYQTEVEKMMQHGGSRQETSTRVAFQKLLEKYCDKKFQLVPEYRDSTISLDGTVKDVFCVSWGYWHHTHDLDKEIQNQLGLPKDNMLFEDSKTAVLIQEGKEVQRVSLIETQKLDELMICFFNYKRPYVREFYQAIERFRSNLPAILDTLHETLKKQTHQEFKTAFNRLLLLCEQSVNSKISALDIHEMIIQHILMEDILLTVFNEETFFRENIVARQINAVVNTFLTDKIRTNTFSAIESFYAVIRQKAVDIVNPHEKQQFFKAIYEYFYKTYNSRTASRLNTVYTPKEIVRFMIEGTDYLLEKHFNRVLADDQVEILDPATGTGTFITELIGYLPKNRLRYKYLNEIHANEVAILPYYVANMNIEYTYKQKMGKYEAFPHICFVDTLNCVSDQQTDENAARIAVQNQQKISVIIGTPPYNIDNNRDYKEIDKAIKKTYIANSVAQKTKLYDMFARFYRWATDRLADDGILAFVTNSSFLEARTFDGFRKLVAEDFNEIYILDLGGNVRKNPKLSGTRNNVFGIQTGVVISLLVKRQASKKPGKIYYARCPEGQIADKFAFLARTKFKKIDFERIVPDKDHNWFNLADNDFDDLLPLGTKEAKRALSQTNEQAIFKRLFWKK